MDGRKNYFEASGHLPGAGAGRLRVGSGDQLELEENPEGFILRPRRLDPPFIPPLRDKIDPNAAPIDMETFRSLPYDPSLRN